jgi:hypothetical protein
MKLDVIQLTLLFIIDILAKNNPKLNEKPRGGNSFQRIDSL